MLSLSFRLSSATWVVLVGGGILGGGGRSSEDDEEDEDVASTPVGEYCGDCGLSLLGLWLPLLGQRETDLDLARLLGVGRFGGMIGHLVEDPSPRRFFDFIVLYGSPGKGARRDRKRDWVGVFAFELGTARWLVGLLFVFSFRLF
jgi:hypothetical protein